MSRVILLKAYRKVLREMGYYRLAILRSTSDQRAFCPACAGREPPVVAALNYVPVPEGIGFACSVCETTIAVPKPVHNWSLEWRRSAGAAAQRPVSK